jgi:hypothetical protein
LTGSTDKISFKSTRLNKDSKIIMNKDTTNDGSNGQFGSISMQPEFEDIG